MTTSSILNSTVDLDDPAVQELQEQLKDSSAPGWPKLAAMILRVAQPDDALVLLGLEMIVGHLDELKGRLGSKRGIFWQWFVDAWKRHESEQEMLGGDELREERNQPPLDRHRPEPPDPVKLVRPAERIGRLLTILRIATGLEREEVAA